MRLLFIAVSVVAVAFCFQPLPVATAQESPTAIPDACLSTVSSAGGFIVVCPQGDGYTLAEVGATVSVTVHDFLDHPIPAIPAADIWLDGCAGAMFLCGGALSNRADAPTDGNGDTTISGTMAAGGSDAGLKVMVQGIPIGCPTTCLPITVHSVDVDGNGKVDIADLALLAQSYTSPPAAYDARVDFDNNGVIDLRDLAIFARHWPPPGSPVHQC